MNFTKIKSIKQVNSEPVFHLTVKKNHNFFANNLCVHNCGYVGEVSVILINLSRKDQQITIGDKIAQIVIQKVEDIEVEEATELPSTIRGEKGFGSSGNV